MLITAEDIAMRTGKSLQAVLRKQFLQQYVAKEVSFGGRPRRYYYKEVLRKFGVDIGNEKITIEKEQELVDVKRKRARNSSCGKPRVINEDLEKRIKTLALRYYLEQSRRDNILRCVEAAVRDLWHLIEKETQRHTQESFVLYYYMKRVMRKSNHYLGYAYAEQWELRWMEHHQKNKYNAELPTNRWDYISLFEDAGLIGQGYGAGLLWSIDATQFDAWIDDGGKPRAMSYVVILDGITAMPLYMQWLEKGETIEAIAEILWRAVQLHGKPKFGIMMDNGAAFRSKEIKAMIRSWYTPAELVELANNEFRKRMFWGQTEPYLYPIAKIPRSPIKSQHERIFDELSRYMQEMLPLSYIGTRDSRAVAHEIGTTPVAAVQNRPTREAAWAGFLEWMVEAIFMRNQPKLAFLKKRGYETNLLGLWRYYGGRVNIDRSKELTDMIEPHSVSKDLPANARYYALYAAGTKHEVKAGIGGCVVTENGQQYNFVSDYLDVTLANKKVKVVIDNGEGIIMKEWQNNEPDPRTPDKDSLYFVGVAQNAFIRKVGDLEIKQRTTEIRNKLQKSIKLDTERYVGGKVVVQNKLKGIKLEEKQLEEPEQKHLESDFDDIDNLLLKF
jgi:hypothetical protein